MTVNPLLQTLYMMPVLVLLLHISIRIVTYSLMLFKMSLSSYSFTVFWLFFFCNVDDPVESYSFQFALF